jgi:hypothetical protein
VIISDRVYGQVNIKANVLLELIKAKSVQRLKGISQFGIPDDYYNHKNYSRYEHSVGVMLLLKRLGASEEEQVAGLLHDVSHTAFSHVIDWVVGDGKTEDYQDEQHAKFIRNSEIPGILKKYGYDSERIIDYHLFGLLERDIPDLCADRVDYSFREAPQNVLTFCLPAMAALDQKIVIKNQPAATRFARYYLKQQIEHWGSFEAVARYRAFSDALRLALDDQTITEDDFWQDDDFITDKLKASKNKSIQLILRTLRHKSLAYLAKSSVTAYKKFRYVDPLFLSDKKLLRLSDVDKPFRTEIEQARQLSQRGIVVPQVIKADSVR